MNIAWVALMPGSGLGGAEHAELAEQRPEEEAGERGAEQLHDHVAGHAPPGEVAARGEGDARPPGSGARRRRRP